MVESSGIVLIQTLTSHPRKGEVQICDGFGKSTRIVCKLDPQAQRLLKSGYY